MHFDKWDICKMRMVAAMTLALSCMACSKPEPDTASRAARTFAGAYCDRDFEKATPLCTDAAKMKIGHDARAYAELKSRDLIEPESGHFSITVLDSTGESFILSLSNYESNGGPGSEVMKLDLRQDSTWKITNYQFISHAIR